MPQKKPQKTIIALTGMMGCGKTTTAIEIAKLLTDFKKVEMDEIISQQEEMSINQIFERKGEEYFRAIESRLLKELCNQQKLIISMGGGAFLSPQNRQYLAQNALSIYLSALPQTIYNRVKEDKSRPLLNTKNLENKIKEILKQRTSIYEKADVEIKTDNKSVSEIVQEIMEIYKKYGNS